MPRVIIEPGVKTESGTSSKGKPFTSRSQSAYLQEPGKKFPTSCKIELYDGAREYPAGDFDSTQDLEISEFGRLQVKRELMLTPAPVGK